MVRPLHDSEVGGIPMSDQEERIDRMVNTFIKGQEKGAGMSKTSIALPNCQEPLSPEILGERFYNGELCSNCDDGCLKEKWCEGCGQYLCTRCWDEHENDGPCHVGR